MIKQIFDTARKTGGSSEVGWRDQPGSIVIKKGDTLGRIADRYDTSVEALIQANHKNRFLNAKKKWVIAGGVLNLPPVKAPDKWMRMEPVEALSVLLPVLGGLVYAGNGGFFQPKGESKDEYRPGINGQARIQDKNLLGTDGVEGRYRKWRLPSAIPGVTVALEKLSGGRVTGVDVTAGIRVTGKAARLSLSEKGAQFSVRREYTGMRTLTPQGGNDSKLNIKIYDDDRVGGFSDSKEIKSVDISVYEKARATMNAQGLKAGTDVLVTEAKIPRNVAQRILLAESLGVGGALGGMGYAYAFHLMGVESPVVSLAGGVAVIQGYNAYRLNSELHKVGEPIPQGKSMQQAIVKGLGKGMLIGGLYFYLLEGYQALQRKFGELPTIVNVPVKYVALPMASHAAVEGALTSHVTQKAVARMAGSQVGKAAVLAQETWAKSAMGRGAAAVGEKLLISEVAGGLLKAVPVVGTAFFLYGMVQYANAEGGLMEGLEKGAQASNKTWAGRLGNWAAEKHEGVRPSYTIPAGVRGVKIANKSYAIPARYRTGNWSFVPDEKPLIVPSRRRALTKKDWEEVALAMVKAAGPREPNKSLGRSRPRAKMDG